MDSRVLLAAAIVVLVIGIASFGFLSPRSAGAVSSLSTPSASPSEEGLGNQLKGVDDLTDVDLGPFIAVYLTTYLGWVLATGGDPDFLVCPNQKASGTGNGSGTTCDNAKIAAKQAAKANCFSALPSCPSGSSTVCKTGQHFVTTSTAVCGVPSRGPDGGLYYTATATDSCYRQCISE